MKLIRLIAIALIWLPATAPSTSAQSLGGPSGVRSPATAPSFGASRGTEILRHRDFSGKPCLEVTGSARAHVANPKVYDHVITAHNNCPQSIAVEVCYYHTYDCIPMAVPGGERKEAVLGTLPSMPGFRFEFREKF